MSPARKSCPICQTENPPAARSCHHCGSDLSQIRAAPGGEADERQPYAFERGETDLLEEELAGHPLVRVLSALVPLLALVPLALIVVLALSAWPPGSQRENPPPSAMPASAIPLATVTAGPPTQPPSPWPSATALPTLKPTVAPCVQTVSAGDTLIALALRCGHRHRDILELVVNQNGLASAEQLQIGQQIVIPWPTATAAGAGNAQDAAPANSAFVIPTSTLPPGLMWHQVRLGEDIVGIAGRYGVDLAVMSQLNPEVRFSQCDLGNTYGGESCIVQIFEGQQLRVPAPTAPPSITPTPNFDAPVLRQGERENIPYILRPGNGVVYRADELVTLRWLSSSALKTDEIFIVEVIDLTAAQRYLQETRAIALRLPDGWQGNDGRRHQYRWRVGLRSGREVASTVWTEERNFVWIARSGNA